VGKKQRDRSGGSLKRRVARRRELRKVLVFTEGRVTEPTYVEALRSVEAIRENTSLSLIVAPEHRQPLPLVREAIKSLDDPELHQIWCLFDVEAPRSKMHPGLPDAISLASAHGILLGVSNPCFELWLLLHDEDATSYLTTRDAVAAANCLPEVVGKTIDAAQLVARRSAAVRRARKLDERHSKNGTAHPDDNPSTTVYRLIEGLEGTEPG
jgi:hypothetical protein